MRIRTTSQSDMSLGIHRIEPVNLSDPLIQGSLETTRRSLKNRRLAGIMTIRTAIQHYLCSRLVQDGYMHPPIYMLAGCTDPLNHWTYPARLNYYGEEISVSQSLILQKILMVMLSPVDKVFWASPNIRMEMRVSRKEYKYASEFMQVDFEKKYGTFKEMLEYNSSLITGLYSYLKSEHAETIRRIRGEDLPELAEPPQIYDAGQYLGRNGCESHDDLERLLSKNSDGKPFMIVNMKREAYDCFDRAQGRYLNYDIIIPPYGSNVYPVECMSGAERTRSLDDLEQRMVELGYPMDYFAPFFELYSSMAGSNRSISCAGAGFGVERLTYAILGLSDIHEVYPFPRMAEARIAF